MSACTPSSADAKRFCLTSAAKADGLHTTASVSTVVRVAASPGAQLATHMSP